MTTKSINEFQRIKLQAQLEALEIVKAERDATAREHTELVELARQAFECSICVCAKTDHSQCPLSKLAALVGKETPQKEIGPDLDPGDRFSAFRND